MTKKFMGLRYRDFLVKSKYGSQVALMAQTETDALYTGAELLDEPVENLTVTTPSEWE